MDEHWFQTLSEAQRNEVHEAAARPRSELVQALLTNPLLSKEEGGEKTSLMESLGADYNLRFYRFARDPKDANDLNNLALELDDRSSNSAPSTRPGSQVHRLSIAPRCSGNNNRW